MNFWQIVIAVILGIILFFPALFVLLVVAKFLTFALIGLCERINRLVNASRRKEIEQMDDEKERKNQP